MKNLSFGNVGKHRTAVYCMCALSFCAVLLCCAVSCRRIEPDVPAVASVEGTVTEIQTTVPPDTEKTELATSTVESETEQVTEETELTTEPPETEDVLQTGEVLVVDVDEAIFAPLDELLSHPPVEDANVAFYYEDMASGTSYAFNADELTYSASLIKLPYILALLYEAENQDMGFDEIFTYTGEEDPFGSGQIKNEPIGSTYTHLELIEYTLRMSDNIAFGQLRDKHGMQIYFDFARSIGADSLTAWDGWVLTARDGGKVLHSVWDYIEGDYLYSEEIKNAMVSSTHTVMLCPGLSGKQMARKYGWDDRAYHDMGIVYDEHPYILVFLSDMVSGDAEVNSYINSIARAADMIHAQIYAGTGIE